MDYTYVVYTTFSTNWFEWSRGRGNKERAGSAGPSTSTEFKETEKELKPAGLKPQHQYRTFYQDLGEKIQ